MTQLAFSFMEKEDLKDLAQDLFAWLNSIMPQLFANQADEGRRLMDELWRRLERG